MTRISPSPVRPKTAHPREKEARAYKGFIAALGSEHGAGCVVCGTKPCHVAHYRGGESCVYCCGTGAADSEDGCEPCNGTGYRYGKVPAMRHHRFTLPLCPGCHQNGPKAQHKANERLWWADKGVDPLLLCHELQGIWDNRKSDAEAIERGTRAILEARHG